MDSNEIGRRKLDIADLGILIFGKFDFFWEKALKKLSHDNEKFFSIPKLKRIETLLTFIIFAS